MTYTSNQPVWFLAVPPNAETGGLFGRLAHTLLALALLQTGPARPKMLARIASPTHSMRETMCAHSKLVGGLLRPGGGVSSWSSLEATHRSPLRSPPENDSRHMIHPIWHAST